MIWPAKGLQMIMSVTISVCPGQLCQINRLTAFRGTVSEHRDVFSIGQFIGASEEFVKVETCEL